MKCVEKQNLSSTRHKAWRKRNIKFSYDNRITDQRESLMSYHQICGNKYFVWHTYEYSCTESYSRTNK